MTQDDALAMLLTGANVFLTGEPGSGKTHTVRRYIDLLRSHGVRPAITASTGIAATHLNGMTIHSWSGIGVRETLTKEDCRYIASNRRVARRIEKTRVLVIDEISMLSARTFAMIDHVCRAVRESAKPFGGMQTVLVGDFFQLPPVVKRSAVDDREHRLPFANTTNDPAAQFAFLSPSWHALNPTVCYLTEQHRQDDPDFLSILSGIRSGALMPHLASVLRNRKEAMTSENDDWTKLFSHNEDVDRVNDERLRKLPGKTHAFAMESYGPEAVIASLKRSCLSPERLLLKVGAAVMFTKNNIEGGFVNGTTGTITGFDKETGFPVVESRSGKRIVAEPMEWTVEADGRPIAGVTQVPLRLAWAITVHKSQGMSLDAAVIDLSAAFEYGQGYVALSRVRSLDGLILLGLNDRALEVHPDMIARDTAFRSQSDEVEQALRAMHQRHRAALQRDFIRSCGGSMDSRKSDASTSGRHPADETLALIKTGKTIADIARLRERKEDTIITHLELLKRRGRLVMDDIRHLIDDAETFAQVREAIQTLGGERLQPIHEHFRGRISYSTIRLARLLSEFS